MLFFRALTTFSLLYTAIAAPLSSADKIDVDLEKKSLEKRVTDAVYAELDFYFHYASSAYSIVCPKPNGNSLVLQYFEESTDTQGFIARDDTRKEIVVTLRGTSSVADAFTDLQIIQKAYSSPGVTPANDVYVHGGFLDAYNAVASTIIKSVKAQLAAYPDYTIVTSGHSLGGSLSALAAVSLKANFPGVPIRMYTYGQPRTGNKAWATWVNSLFGADAKRSVNTNDGVPTILPTWLGYYHHGVEYWTTGFPATAANTRQCDATGEDSTCSGTKLSGGINLAHTTYFNTLAIIPFCT